MTYFVLFSREIAFKKVRQSILSKFKVWLKSAVLKLGVATHLRVAKCPKRVAKFEKGETFGVKYNKERKN